MASTSGTAHKRVADCAPGRRRGSRPWPGEGAPGILAGRKLRDNRAGGRDVAKSALARLLIERVALPAALLPGPHVAIGAVDAARFTATVSLHGETITLTIAVDGEGRVRELSLPRWGNQMVDGAFRPIPYGATVEEERACGGYTIPSRMRAGWWFGTGRYLEVIRLRVDRGRGSGSRAPGSAGGATAGGGGATQR